MALLTAFKHGSKLVIVGGAINLTVAGGVWGTADEGEQAWNRLLQTVVPQTSENISEHLKSPVPLANATENWNTGVKGIIESVSNISELTSQYSSQAYLAMQEWMKQE